jgi:hypothetical protein
MPVWIGIWRVEDGPLEKAFHEYVSLRRSTGAALSFVVMLTSGTGCRF